MLGHPCWSDSATVLRLTFDFSTQVAAIVAADPLKDALEPVPEEAEAEDTSGVSDSFALQVCAPRGMPPLAPRPVGRFAQQGSLKCCAGGRR